VQAVFSGILFDRDSTATILNKRSSNPEGEIATSAGREFVISAS
jgi:hypothetical protein